MRFSLFASVLFLSSQAGVGAMSLAEGSGYTYYPGNLAPENWANLTSFANNQCGGVYAGGTSGFGQSPITITQDITAQCDDDMKDYRFEGGNCTWFDLKFEILSNGVKVGPKPGATCYFGKMMTPQETQNAFNVLQFHIHTSSEHQIEGQGSNGAFPAGLHIVHQETTEGSLAVLGSTMTIGQQDNELFEWFLQGWEAAAQYVETLCKVAAVTTDGGTWTALPSSTCPAPIGDFTYFNDVQPRYDQAAVDFPEPNVYQLGTIEGTYTYKGGLTTPPCTEIVYWNVVDAPIEISLGQLDRLEKLILCYVKPTYDNDGKLEKCDRGTVATEDGSTARPVQPLMGRPVKHYCLGPLDDIYGDVEDLLTGIIGGLGGLLSPLESGTLGGL